MLSLNDSNIIEYLGQKPAWDASTYVAPGASLIGQVSLAKDSSVFFNCVLRADINSISIGERSNVQDNTVLHVSDKFGVQIGQEVSIGHSCTIHACTLENNILVGMGSVIMDGTHVGSNSIIGAGSLLPMNKTYPPGHLILGRPAKVIRSLTNEEMESILKLSQKYVTVKNNYLKRYEIS